MSSEPVFGPRQAQPLDDILKRVESISLDELERVLDPAGKLDLDQRVDEIAPIAYALGASHDGRQLLDWLCDLTLRRPFSVAGMNIEQAALYAARREGENAVIHSLIKAIRKGQDEYEAKRS